MKEKWNVQPRYIISDQCVQKKEPGCVVEAGNTKGGLFDSLGISCMTTDNFCFYLQNRLIQTSQTGGQWYSDTSPFSIPW